MTRRRHLFLAFLLLAGSLRAQLADAPGGGPGSPPITSPEVHPDRRVSVRLFAPQAREVRLHFERGGEALHKRSDGLWEATVGPLDPGSYRYGFSVDGANVTDPRNIEVERMQVLTRSILYVPGAAFMDTRDVPHGAVSVVTYRSKVLSKVRRMHVYTPPGYEAGEQSYPVLYLLHGANESDQSWSAVGRAGYILDNLIADGRAVPMIVVMPNGHADQTPPVIFDGPHPLSVELTAIPEEFATDVVPYVESHYRVRTDRPNRAIAGLSMGGTQTLNIALANLDQFSAVGVFSSGILGSTIAEWENAHLRALDDAKAKKGLKTTWFRTGSDDFLLTNTRSTVEMLRQHGFNVSFEETPGAHTWVNWRNYLNEFAPLLFR